MTAGKDVRPHRWSNVIDLYDDGNFSAIWGEFDGPSARCLGVRWNGEDDCGYPNLAGNPLWFVMPKKFAKTMLLDFCFNVTKDPSYGGNLENIHTALKEC